MPEYKTVQLYGGKVTVKFTEDGHAYYIDGKRKAGVTTFLGIINKPNLIGWAVDTAIEYIKAHPKEMELDGKALLELARGEADRVRDYAAETGKAIHAWAEAHIKGERPDMPTDPRVLTGVNNFLEWVDSHKMKLVSSERIVYSLEHDYIGTLDIEAVKGRKRYLIDIKTGNSLYPEVKPQTAAYLKADEEESGKRYDGRWALRISKETEEEYNIRIEEKNRKAIERGKLPYPCPPYRVFEALYLDEDKEALQRDFDGFLAAQRLYRWQQTASKELANLKSLNNT